MSDQPHVPNSLVEAAQPELVHHIDALVRAVEAETTMRKNAKILGLADYHSRLIAHIPVLMDELRAAGVDSDRPFH